MQRLHTTVTCATNGSFNVHIFRRISDDLRPFRRKSVGNCRECEGSGHYKTDCPTLKKRNSLRCFECNGYGHTKSDCLAAGKNEKSYVTLSESDSDDDQENGEILNNFVAYLGVIEEEECEDSTKPINQDQVSDSEEEEQSKFTLITALIDELAATKKEKQLLSEENKHLVNQISTLKSELKDEKAKTGNLEQKLGERA
ncbi:hypothetical protein V5N11_019633 [Cardamine amara subsp. amara]|uniref:CCHC-type domain-containing protein n=1 Tax=Cardamine amara subsp. amara TaxID=228776 RepID=A0ABD1BWK5_CARAN